MTNDKLKGPPQNNTCTLTTRAEMKRVEERVAIGAHTAHETSKPEGEHKRKRTSSAVAWLGLTPEKCRSVESLPLHRSNPHVADNIRTQTRKSRGNHCQDYKTYD